MAFKFVGILAVFVLSSALSVASNGLHYYGDDYYAHDCFELYPNHTDEVVNLYFNRKYIPNKPMYNKVSYCLMQYFGVISPRGNINYDETKWVLLPRAFSKWFRPCMKRVEGEKNHFWGRILLNCMIEIIHNKDRTDD